MKRAYYSIEKSQDLPDQKPWYFIGILSEKLIEGIAIQDINKINSLRPTLRMIKSFYEARKC